MKSGRYEILPRVRKVRGLIDGMESVNYKCTWKDPGNLVQHAGCKLRFVAIHIGYGATITEAIQGCQMAYINHKLAKDTARQDVDRMCSPPRHTIATSNLPWWRRLFRL